MAKSILEQIRERESEKFDLHERYLNAQHVRVLKTIGFDRHYVRANGPYLYDDKGDQYLDLLSGFGVFSDAVASGGVVRGIRAPGSSWPRGHRASPGPQP